MWKLEFESIKVSCQKVANVGFSFYVFMCKKNVCLYVSVCWQCVVQKIIYQQFLVQYICIFTLDSDVIMKLTFTFIFTDSMQSLYLSISSVYYFSEIHFHYTHTCTHIPSFIHVFIYMYARNKPTKPHNLYKF